MLQFYYLAHAFSNVVFNPPVFCRVNAARSTWTWDALLTFYTCTSRRLNSLSPFSLPCFFENWRPVGPQFSYDGMSLMTHFNRYLFKPWRSTLLVSVVVSGAVFNVNKSWMLYGNEFFPLAEYRKDNKIRADQHLNYWESHCLSLLSSSCFEMWFPCDVKSNRVPL